MKTQYLIIFFLIFSSYFSSQAQNKKRIDSLLSVLNSAIIDTTKVNTLSALSFNFSNTDSTKAFQYARQGLELSQKIKYRKGIANCYNNIGLIYKNLGNFDQAIENYKNALSVFIEIDDNKGKAKTFLNIGTVHNEQSDYTKAISFFMKAQWLYEVLNDNSGMAKSYSMFPVIFIGLPV